MPDGSKKSGATGADGFIRVSGLEDTGDCTLTFPDVDTPPPENPDPDDAGATS
jgi:hypothetical protein